jgi:hypothetical protein
VNARVGLRESQVRGRRDDLQMAGEPEPRQQAPETAVEVREDAQTIAAGGQLREHVRGAVPDAPRIRPREGGEEVAEEGLEARTGIQRRRLSRRWAGAPFSRRDLPRAVCRRLGSRDRPPDDVPPPRALELLPDLRILRTKGQRGRGAERRRKGRTDARGLEPHPVARREAHVQPLDAPPDLDQRAGDVQEDRANHGRPFARAGHGLARQARGAARARSASSTCCRPVRIRKFGFRP